MRIEKLYEEIKNNRKLRNAFEKAVNSRNMVEMFLSELSPKERKELMGISEKHFYYALLQLHLQEVA